jgi:sigma-B regulation protein RsbU (phosphoserine phosphatase)
MQYNRKESKSNIVLFAVLSGFLMLNAFVVFPYFERYVNGYFAVVLGLDIIVFSLLANAAYYNSRTRINTWNIAVSYFSFLLISNYILALGLHFVDYERFVDPIMYLLGTGRLFFVLGCIPLQYARRLSIVFRGYMQMTISAFILMLVQIILLAVFMKFKVNISNVIFLVNAFTATILLVFVLNRILTEEKNESRMMTLGFALMFFGQVYMTLSRVSTENIIQGHFFQVIGIAYYYFSLNRSNLIIPEQEHLVLQNQFNLYAKNLKKIIDKKTLQVREINDKLIDDLEYAKKIQQSLLPKTKVNYRDVTFLSEYFPCERLSGDFFDLYRLDDDHIALYLMDVSGHGISAALMTMFSSNYLKSNDQNLMRYRGYKPDLNLKHFYDQFNLMNFPDEMHMVLLYATLDLNTKVMTYCSGGLNCNPIRFKKNGKIEFLDKSKGFPICKLSDYYTPEFVSEKIILEKGDRVLFYTDGLIDSEKNGVFDLESLIEFYKENADLSLREINERLLSKINPVKDELNDDITYIFMEV